MIEIEFLEYKILIGKNKSENAELLEKSSPEDYWIHVKDYPSGHVIIKNPTGNKIPNKVLKRACCLLKNSSNKHKSKNNLSFDIAKRKSLILTNTPGEVILTQSKNITI